MNLLSSLYGFAVRLEIFALAAILRFLWNTANRFRRIPETQERRRSRRLGRDALLFLGSLLLFFSGLAFLNFALFLQAYRTFAVGEPIAKVLITGQTGEQNFIARIQEFGQPLSNNNAPLEKEFSLKGDRWMLEGHIIRFQPWLSFLGFRPVYELTRIQGSYYSIDDERAKERTVYPIADPSSEEWWKWMYDSSDRIPFLDLMYGSAVSQDAKDGSRYIVTVLPSGFSLQKAGD